MLWLRNRGVEEGGRREVKQFEIPNSAQSPSEESENSELDSGSGMENSDYFLIHVLGAGKKRPNETVLLSTHNICFG